MSAFISLSFLRGRGTRHDRLSQVAAVMVPLLWWPTQMPLHYVTKQTFLPEGASVVYVATEEVTKTP